MILQIEMNSEVPIYRQIRDGIVLGIGSGKIKDGECLPTVRQLAFDLGVNPMTVNKAYALLKEDGVIVIDRRLGAKVRCRSGGSELQPASAERLRLCIAELLAQGITRDRLKEEIETIIAELGSGHKEEIL